MLIIHGTYHLFPRRVAFRNDYCLTCRAPRRAVQIRTLEVLHVYFIPLVPLGFWRRWSCDECGMCPHPIRLTRRLLELTALVFFLLCTSFFWIVYFFIVPGIAEDSSVFWLFGVISPLGAAAMAAHLATGKPREPGYKERLEAVPPADDVICPFCGVAMVDEFFECHCPGCGVRRL